MDNSQYSNPRNIKQAKINTVPACRVVHVILQKNSIKEKEHDKSKKYIFGTLSHI